MAFGTATVSTNKNKARLADRAQGTPATYTTPAKWIGMGVGATGAGRTAVVGDTALSTEVETRAVGTESIQTTSVTGDTYQVVGTITATAARAVDEAATFDASTAGNIGISATFPVINLGILDSLQLTMKLQLT
jgi:hypothetical protein